MINLAGTGDTVAAIRELAVADIPAVRCDAASNECLVTIQGTLQGWTFKRLWYYWSAHCDGIGVPKENVRPFDAMWGSEARAHGYAGGGALDVMNSEYVDTFHIDSQAALDAFSMFIRMGVVKHKLRIVNAQL